MNTWLASSPSCPSDRQKIFASRCGVAHKVRTPTICSHNGSLYIIALPLWRAVAPSVAPPTLTTRLSAAISLRRSSIRALRRHQKSCGSLCQLVRPAEALGHFQHALVVLQRLDHTDVDVIVAHAQVAASIGLRHWSQGLESNDYGVRCPAGGRAHHPRKLRKPIGSFVQ